VVYDSVNPDLREVQTAIASSREVLDAIENEQAHYLVTRWRRGVCVQVPVAWYDEALAALRAQHEGQA
jgi:DNA-binding winged helix-turn-helix (wHTH) protein